MKSPACILREDANTYIKQFLFIIEALCQIMNDLFDGVIYAGIDTDKHKYPIGKCVRKSLIFLWRNRCDSPSYEILPLKSLLKDISSPVFFIFSKKSHL